MSCRGRREPAAVGHRSHDGHRVGQAALPRVLAEQRRDQPRPMEERRPHFPAARIPERLMAGSPAPSGCIDVNAFLGGYPWRKEPGTTPEAVARAMHRATFLSAWVTHLSSQIWRDP